MFRSLSLSLKIYAAAALVVFLTLASRTIDTVQMQSVAQLVERGVSVDAATMVGAREIQYRTLGLRRFEKDFLINLDSKEKRSKYFEKWEGARAELGEVLLRVENLHQSRAAQDQVMVLRESLTAYCDGFQSVVAAIERGDITTTQDGNAAMGRHKDAVRGMEETADKLADLSQAALSRATVDIETALDNLIYMGWLLTAAVATILALFSVFMAHKLLRPVHSVGHIAHSLAAASAQLAEVVARVSSGGRVQNTSVETTSSSLEELGASIAQNAEHSSNTESLATTGAHDAGQSGKAVEDSVRAMHTIADKVGVIGDIAYQTNLL